MAYAEIAKGRIVLESGAAVEEIHINKRTNSTFDTVIIANNAGAEELPKRITRDAVSVVEETLVVKVESNGSSENVYVYADGATGTKGSTEKVTEGDNKQNENVNSALGQLVLDNGSDGDKAQTVEEKQTAKVEVVETAQNKEEVEKAEGAGYEITHHDALAPTCTEDGHTAYDSYFVNAEERKVGYKVIPATGHDADIETGICDICHAQAYTARIGDVGYASLQTAWNAGANKTVVLLCDLTQNGFYAYGTYTLDLNGHTLTLRGHSAISGAFGTDGGANYSHTNLTIKNGTLELTGANYSNYGIYNYGTLTLKDLTINSACQTVIYANGQQWGTAGTTTLDNVTINSTHSSGTAVAAYSFKSSWAGTVKPTVVIKNSTITAAYNAVMMYAVDATVEGCAISATNNNALWISNAANASGVTGTITVKGNTTITAGSDYRRINAQGSNTIVVIDGTYNFDPSNNNSKNYVDSTVYDVNDNGNETWTVVAK